MNEYQKFSRLVSLKGPESLSQMHQDLFVLQELGEKRNGFFVEFGASDGLLFSNTALLEREFGWTGILAEPAKLYHDQLMRNRKCSLDFRCVWPTTGELIDFSETSAPELSTATSFFDSSDAPRKEIERYQVETVSLNDLLANHFAPTEIDYISVDTEGSEYDILSAFDFDARNVRIFTIEHNWFHTPARQNIYELMTSKGYKRIFEFFSQWDDWYVRRD